jgi:NitT/TauT family transport system permease protein
MKGKINPAKFKKTVLGAIGVIIFLIIWEISARVTNMAVALPTFSETVAELFTLIFTLEFWKIIALSSSRIFLGLLSGVAIGVIFALLTHYVPTLDGLISPLMTIMRSTPVASFVMVLWLIIQLIFHLEWLVPIVIIVIMVAPIIWQNLKNGFDSIDKNLIEVCEIFPVSGKKKLKILIMPSLMRYFIPGVINSVGLAWKSGIAAEIIAYTPLSIGEQIYDAKSFFESPRMFAWTIIVIILSLVFESLLAFLRRGKNGVNDK